IYTAREEALQQQAASVWKDLDFDDSSHLRPAERNALWRLATEDEAVRSRAIGQLPDSIDLLERFGSHPDVVARALGLGWPSARHAYTALMRAIQSIVSAPEVDEGHAKQRKPLVSAAQVLAPMVDLKYRQELSVEMLPAFSTAGNPLRMKTLA